MRNRYYVGIGGEPVDNRVECEDYFVAIDKAYGMALDLAAEKGIDPNLIDTWGEDNPAIGAGACPEDDEGGYWPRVFIHTT